MFLKEEILVKKAGSGNSKKIIVTGCGNALDADKMMESLIEIVNILKEEGCTLVTTDQSGIDYHIRSAAKEVGVKMIVNSVVAMPTVYDRDTVHHKVHYMSMTNRLGYKPIVIEGRALMSMNPDSFIRIVCSQGEGDDFGKLSLIKKNEDSYKSIESVKPPIDGSKIRRFKVRSGGWI